MKSKTNFEIPLNRLRELRITPRISQWRLALMSGIKQSRISLIENRLVKPTEREKIKLAEALHHAVEEIFFNNQPHIGLQLENELHDGRISE